MIQVTFVGLLSIASVCTICLFIFCLMQRDHACKLSFSLLTLSAALFLLGYVFELQSSSAAEALLATKIQYLGIPFLGPLFLLFILDLTGITARRRELITGLMLLAVTSTALVFTSEHHTLYYASYRFVVDGLFPLLDVMPGPFYIVTQLLTAGCNISGCYLLVNHYRKMPSIVRGQALPLIVAAFVPFTINLFYLLGKQPWGLNWTPLAMFVMLLAYWFTTNRQGVFDIVPKAVDMALASMPEAFILLDHDHNLLHANSATHRLFPQLARLKPDESIEVLHAWPRELSELLKLERQENIQRFILESNTGSHHYEASISEVPSPAGVSGWMILVRDISDTVRLMDRLEELAFTDSLTKIANRRYFIESAEREFSKHRREQKPLAMMIMDIDHFKQVNDAYGHLVGDEALRALAAKVSGMLRSFDLFARYGGEEFILLLSGVSAKTSWEIAERIREAVEHTEMEYEGQRFEITISIGVYWIENAEISITEAIRQADAALYQAKEGGRNRVVAL